MHQRNTSASAAPLTPLPLHCVRATRTRSLALAAAFAAAFASVTSGSLPHSRFPILALPRSPIFETSAPTLLPLAPTGSRFVLSPLGSSHLPGVDSVCRLSRRSFQLPPRWRSRAALTLDSPGLRSSARCAKERQGATARRQHRIGRQIAAVTLGDLSRHHLHLSPTPRLLPRDRLRRAGPSLSAQVRRSLAPLGLERVSLGLGQG